VYHVLFTGSSKEEIVINSNNDAVHLHTITSLTKKGFITSHFAVLYSNLDHHTESSYDDTIHLYSSIQHTLKISLIAYRYRNGLFQGAATTLLNSDIEGQAVVLSKAIGVNMLFRTCVFRGDMNGELDELIVQQMSDKKNWTVVSSTYCII